MPVYDRFSSKIQVSTFGNHWLWTGATSKGYGKVWCETTTELAHRAAWQLFKGAIPPEMHVLHRCGVKNCVNPEHLYLGTQLDNAQDAIELGENHNASKTYCKNGHLLSGDNLYIPPSGASRQCRACRQSRNALNYRRRAHGL